ncbi:hypothetical protein HanPSC8_Chr16g0729661 [Helianthus annuus]|nr:hypothetical protein HanPSC8_Chr16g0729661 [Helianthus annuus]
MLFGSARYGMVAIRYQFIHRKNNKNKYWYPYRCYSTGIDSVCTIACALSIFIKTKYLNVEIK